MPAAYVDHQESTGNWQSGILIEKPAGSDSTHLLSLTFNIHATNLANLNVPSGWTLALSTSSSYENICRVVYWAVGSVSDTTWTVSGSPVFDNASPVVTSFSGADLTDPVRAAAGVASAPDGVDLPSPGVTAGADDLIQTTYHQPQNSTALSAAPSGYTRYYNGTSPARNTLMYREGVSAGATGDIANNANAAYENRIAQTIAWKSGSSGTDYELTCDTGAYTLTGVAATTRRGARIVADVGSYAITGVAASTSRGYRLVGDVGAYTLTGVAAGTRRGARLVAAVGSYALTGVAATTSRGIRLIADVGAYSLTGQDATLTYSAGAANYTLSCDVGSYALTGIDATLTYTPGTANYTLTCDTGSYALTGQNAVTSLGRRLIGDVGSYSLTGIAASTSRGYRLTSDTGAYTLTGIDATLTGTAATDYSLVCEPGAYSIGGQDATLRYSGEVVPRRRHAGTRKNYIIKGQKYALTDYELALLIQQMLNEVKRPEVQVVTEKEVKQISRKVWKRLKDSLTNLEALTLEAVQEVVESNVIEYDDEDDEEILMLL